MNERRIELPNRVWLARFGSSRPDPVDADWTVSAEQFHQAAPAVWSPTFLETANGFGPGVWWGPTPGDRVVVYRASPHRDILGVWLVTEAVYGAKGFRRLAHRPLARCSIPVKVDSLRRAEPDLKARWDSLFGASARSRFLVELTDSALLSIIGATGVDPALLFDPEDALPSLPVVTTPAPVTPRATVVLTTDRCPDARNDDDALISATLYMFGCGSEAPDLIETRRRFPGRGSGFVARDGDHVGRFVAVHRATSADGLALHPDWITEASECAQFGVEWGLLVQTGEGSAACVDYYDAREVAEAFSIEGEQTSEMLSVDDF